VVAQYFVTSHSPVADPGLNFGGGTSTKVQKFATKLVKHSVEQRKTTVIGGGGKCPPLDPPLTQFIYYYILS